VIATNGESEFVGPDQVLHFIMTYTIPNNETIGDIAVITPVVTSVGDATVTDNTSYSKTTLIANAVLTANISGNVTTAKPGDTITYTISGSNTGSLAAYSILQVTGSTYFEAVDDPTYKDGILVWNQIPSQFTLSGSGSVVVGPSNSKIVYSNDGKTWSITPIAGAPYIGMFMPDPKVSGNNISEATLPAGNPYNMTYNVTVNSNAMAGVVGNDALTYYKLSPGSGLDQSVKSNTFNVTIVVTNTYGALLGYSGTMNTGDETQVAPSGNAGSYVDFTNVVRNTSSATQDIYNIEILSHNFPTGTTFQLLYKNGTPLGDTNNDGKPDTGYVDPNPAPVNTAKDREIVVRVNLPGNATATGAPFSVRLQATSVGDNTKKDTTIDQLTTIVAAGFNFNNRNADGSANTDPVDLTNIAPGTTQDFNLRVENTGGDIDTFNLSVVISDPTNYIVTFYLDANKDGSLSAGELVPITSTTLSPSEIGWVVARVQVPAGEEPGKDTFTFTAKSNNNSQEKTVVNSITIKTVYGVTIEPDQAKPGAPGSIVIYSHVIANTGNGNDTFALSINPPSPSGWTYIFYNSSGQPITSIAVNAGQTATVTVQAFVPSNAAPFSTDAATIEAKSNGDTTGNTKDIATDTTTVYPKLLDLVKKVHKAQAKPQEDVVYTIDYRNLSTGSLTKVVIDDTVPQYTTFQSCNAPEEPGNTTAVAITYSKNGTDYYSSPSHANIGGTQYVRFLRWTFATNVPAGFYSASSTNKSIIFMVKID